MSEDFNHRFTPAHRAIITLPRSIVHPFSRSRRLKPWDTRNTQGFTSICLRNPWTLDMIVDQVSSSTLIAFRRGVCSLHTMLSGPTRQGQKPRAPALSSVTIDTRACKSMACTYMYACGCIHGHRSRATPQRILILQFHLPSTRPQKSLSVPVSRHQCRHLPFPLVHLPH